MTDCNITIIGGGVIGTAIAYELSKQDDQICLLEKNKRFPGENQTVRNSGVIHAGIYYDKTLTPLKAKLCTQGNQLLYQFCQEQDVQYKRTGKLIVATNHMQDQTLDLLLKRANENQVPDVKKINSDQSNKLEPNINCYSALYVPTSGIIEPTEFVRKLRYLSKLEDFFLCGTEVIGIKQKDGECIITTKTHGNGITEFSTKYLINAAGLYSDQVARLINPNFPLTIFPVRGESAKFYPKQQTNVSRNIYPTPEFFQKPDGTRQLTVGVHLTPTFGNEITVGPLNIPGVAKDDYATNLNSTKVFHSKIAEFFPNIQADKIHLHQTGIQAVLENQADFHIAPDSKHQNLINLVGICSPGLTASLAIAKLVASYLDS